MTGPVPAVVTVHLWRVPAGAVPRALLRMATDREHIRRAPGVRFAKLLGTGTGRTFTVRDADLRRYALLATWSDRRAASAFEQSPVVRGWGRLAGETFRAELRPVSSRGRWCGREPFGAPVPRPTSGPVAALTRARLRPTRAAAFWRAVPAVSVELPRQAGLRAAIGIGEAPVGLQGTFSLWDSSLALREFARGAAHAQVVRRTAAEHWYAEELFARFEVVATAGTLDGVEPLR